MILVTTAGKVGSEAVRLLAQREKAVRVLVRDPLLRNNAYMQNFLMAAPSIVKTSSFGSAARGGRVGMIDTRDVAAVAAQIAASPFGRATGSFEQFAADYAAAFS
jgi:uncharacterized protein YbjT (DUF2867 family)